MRGRVAFSFMAGLLAALLCFSEAAYGAKRGAAQSTGKYRDVTALSMKGVIGPGSYREFVRFIRRTKPDLIVLEGPGGVLGEAILIADEVHRRGISTAVKANTHCASACAVIFLAGRAKFMGRGAKVGLHSASFIDGQADPEATDVMAAYLAELGVPASTLQRMAMTAPDHIRWLTKAEQKALGIKTIK
jgi:hypothetical protein